MKEEGIEEIKLAKKKLLESYIVMCEGILKEYIENGNVLSIRATEIILDELRKMLEEV